MTSLCLEAQECVIAGRWLDLASLMITSADLVFSKASDKGSYTYPVVYCMYIYIFVIVGLILRPTIAIAHYVKFMLYHYSICF